MHDDGVSADIKYTNRIYKNDAEHFEFFKEAIDEEEESMIYPLVDITTYHFVWKKASRHCNTVIKNQKDQINALRIAKQNTLQNTWDMKDIDDFYKLNGRGPKLLELDFRPTTNEPVAYLKGNGKPGEKWIWKHRKVESQSKLGITRFASSSGKSFDTGSLTKFLSRINKKTYPEEYARAQHIMQLNGAVTIDVDDIPTVSLDRRTLLKQQVCVFCRWCISHVTNMMLLNHS